MVAMTVVHQVSPLAGRRIASMGRQGRPNQMQVAAKGGDHVGRLIRLIPGSNLTQSLRAPHRDKWSGFAFIELWPWALPRLWRGRRYERAVEYQSLGSFHDMSSTTESTAYQPSARPHRLANYGRTAPAIL
eukprot:1268364-Amphidinium_carterae.1